MGQNLVLNMNDHGFVVSVYNRTVSKVDDFLANEAKGIKSWGHTVSRSSYLTRSVPSRDATSQSRPGSG